MRIVSWNVNGLRAVHRKGFLDWLKSDDPDIICLQETKLKQTQVPDVLAQMPGYHKYFSEAEKTGYSGVAVFTKPRPTRIAKGFGIRHFDNEGRILIAEYDRFILFNIYFPNGKASKERLAYKMAFYAAFFDYAERLRAKGHDLIICGDVNTAHQEIDLARPRENSKTSGFLPEERAWLDRFIDHGYLDTFRLFNKEGGHYSWWDQKTRARDRNVGWRIDYFFINDTLKKYLRAAFILPEVHGSDHCPVGIEISI
jgi:exodeoxyribonuclease-3